MTREEAVDVLQHNYPSACFTDLCEAVEIAIQALSAQPERKKGKWIRNDNGTYSCSLCQSWIPEEQHYYARFCLYCGVKMEGTEWD